MGFPTPDVIKEILANRVKEFLADSSLVPAAVLILIFPKNGENCILLSQRSYKVEHHKGEISFPGGTRDPNDRDFLDTALRETEEEMGVKRTEITILGELDEIATRSDFGVRVFIGSIPYHYLFNPNSTEIAEVLEVPISVLQNPSNLRYETHLINGESVTYNNYTYNNHLIFGATARILQQFLQVLGTVD
jgi:8-oxo-dGTP pyrophosphatase MutT (NUDIX family)